MCNDEKRRDHDDQKMPSESEATVIEDQKRPTLVEHAEVRRNDVSPDTVSQQAAMRLLGDWLVRAYLQKYEQGAQYKGAA